MSNWTEARRVAHNAVLNQPGASAWAGLLSTTNNHTHPKKSLVKRTAKIGLGAPGKRQLPSSQPCRLVVLGGTWHLHKNTRYGDDGAETPPLSESQNPSLC